VLIRRLPQQRRSDLYRFAGNLAGLVLLSVSVVVGATGFWAQLGVASAKVSRIEATPLDHGQLVISRAWNGQRMGFAEFARHLIPTDEPVRIVQPAKGHPREQRVCRNGVAEGDHFWIVYLLVPRPETCDPYARWSVYLGISPGALPPGARAYVYSHDLVVVRRGGS
jgi:hypothetical protein